MVAIRAKYSQFSRKMDVKKTVLQHSIHLLDLTMTMTSWKDSPPMQNTLVNLTQAKYPTTNLSTGSASLTTYTSLIFLKNTQIVFLP